MKPPDTISSTDNPRVKRLSSLRTASGRREAGLFPVEGRRAIGAVVEAGLELVELVQSEAVEPLPGLETTLVLSTRAFARVSNLAEPPGHLGTFRIPTPQPPKPAEGGLVLVGVSDPGNLGTLLRCAAAFGIAQVALCGGADPWSPKVVQAATGALGRVRFVSVASPDDLAGGAALCALVVRDGLSPRRLPPGPRWVLVGNEAHGLPDAWLEASAQHLTLPMPGGTESLNAAIAGAIALYSLGPGREDG